VVSTLHERTAVPASPRGRKVPMSLHGLHRRRRAEHLQILSLPLGIKMDNTGNWIPPVASLPDSADSAADHNRFTASLLTRRFLCSPPVAAA
jgi:hypothetical protein